MKQLWIGMGSVVLVGCVSPKPVMTEEGYRQYAGKWVVINECISRGWMDPDTGARGRRYIQAELGGIQFDTEKLNNLSKEFASDVGGLKQSHCNAVATYIAERKQQIDNHNEMVERDIQQSNQMRSSQQSKQVFCNTVAGVTMCNNGI